MKRKFASLCMALVFLLLLTACGSSAARDTVSNSSMSFSAESVLDYGGDAMKDESILEEELETPAEAQGDASENSGRKFIVTAHMEMETTSFEEAVSGLKALTEEYGGWYEESSLANRKSGSRWASYTVRVSADRYEDFMNSAGSLCHETWRESRSEEITEAYYDTQGRLKTQQIKLERLQELLARAEIMEDIITLESAISETEWQIENLSGTLRQYDSKVDYATIYITLNEVYRLSNVETVPESFGERMGRAFTDGMRAFGDNLENLAVGFAYSWMWWLLVAAVVAVVVRFARKRTGKQLHFGRRKKTDRKDEP